VVRVLNKKESNQRKFNMNATAPSEESTMAQAAKLLYTAKATRGNIDVAINLA
jgi:hypothetical protein